MRSHLKEITEDFAPYECGIPPKETTFNVNCKCPNNSNKSFYSVCRCSTRQIQYPSHMVAVDGRSTCNLIYGCDASSGELLYLFNGKLAIKFALRFVVV